MQCRFWRHQLTYFHRYLKHIFVLPHMNGMITKVTVGGATESTGLLQGAIKLKTRTYFFHELNH